MNNGKRLFDYSSCQTRIVNPQYQYDRLQKVVNAAARVTCLIPKFAHITPVLRELHWLPVKFRVEFKIANMLECKKGANFSIVCTYF